MTNATLPADTRVKTSERLFSEEVALAEAEAPLPVKDIAYEFNNGRKFEAPKP